MAGSRVPQVTNAAVDGLRADATLIGASLLNGQKIYTLVPEDTAPPYVWVLGGREVPWADSMRSHDPRQVDVDLVTISKYRGTAQVDDITHRVMEVLDTRATWTGIVGYAGHEFVENREPSFAEIGGEIFIERALKWRLYVN